MKKTVAVICLIASMQAAFTQNQTTDSFKEILSKTSKPLERFILLNKIIDFNDATQGTLQDTTIGLRMHRIAQQLKNDSLLAISTNVIGNYFRGKSDIPTVLDYFFNPIPLAEKIKDTPGSCQENN